MQARIKRNRKLCNQMEDTEFCIIKIMVIWRYEALNCKNSLVMLKDRTKAYRRCIDNNLEVLINKYLSISTHMSSFSIKWYGYKYGMCIDKLFLGQIIAIMCLSVGMAL